MPLSSKIRLKNFQRSLATKTSASNDWVHRFKQGHGHSWRTISGEAACVNPSDVDKWTSGPLATFLEDYNPDDIYNCDETGLFWKLQIYLSSKRGRHALEGKEVKNVLQCFLVLTCLAQKSFPSSSLASGPSPGALKGLTHTVCPLTTTTIRRPGWILRSSPLG